MPRRPTAITEGEVDLSKFSEGELLELMVSSDSSNKRVLVIWIYLQSDQNMTLDEFDRLLPSLAEAEMQRRAKISSKT